MTSYNFIFDQTISFEQKMERVLEYQMEKCSVYSVFCDNLKDHNLISAESAFDLNTIPLLPVEAFKDTIVSTVAVNQAQTLRFKSSGTTSMLRSTHFVPEPGIYRQSLWKGIQQFFKMEDYVILAYTPGYNENPSSSLIWMLNELIKKDKSGLSRFLELNEPISAMALDAIRSVDKRVMLFGAAFGLLDMSESFRTILPEDAIIIETGGMKTHRREMSRSELHAKLAASFGLPQCSVYSEYGMTEMLSQAYSDFTHRYKTPEWMEISIRNPHNPLEAVPIGKEGLIGVVDLANFYSCSFILTGDKGVKFSDGSFEVLGRYRPSQLRGCNFLIDQD
ncbi:MAG: hypothetical protein LAT67_03325 [Balneolales bacterium]|nr:hypothetical protein [Balneolales bacterium]